jgi:hypothetical protein
VDDALLDPELMVVVCHGTFSDRVSPHQLVRALFSLFMMKRPGMNEICADTISNGRNRRQACLGGSQIRVVVQFIARDGLDNETVLRANKACPACSSLEEV